MRYKNESMRCGDLRRQAFHTLESPNHHIPTGPIDRVQCTERRACPTCAHVRKEWAVQTCDCFNPRGLLPLGLWHALLPTRERVIRKGEVRVVFVVPCLAMPWGPMWKTRRAWPANQNMPAAEAGRGWPGLAGAGRGWPRLAKTGGHPELDPALAGRIIAGGRIGRRLWAAVFHIARPPCFCSDSLWRSGRL